MRSWLALIAPIALTCAACTDDANQFVDAANKRSGITSCKEKGRCAGMVHVDCGAAVDGPAYYFDEATAEVISTCGGVCFDPSDAQRQVCATLCPPPAWTCAR